MNIKKHSYLGIDWLKIWLPIPRGVACFSYVNIGKTKGRQHTFSCGKIYLHLILTTKRIEP